MNEIKTEKEIEVMRQGGKILAEVISSVLKKVKLGISEIELDRLAERLIQERGAQPAFKKVKGYNHALCISTNDVVVHGIPTLRKFKEGDIVGIDCGVFYKGLNTDMAETIIVAGPAAGGRGPVSNSLPPVLDFLVSPSEPNKNLRAVGSLSFSPPLPLLVSPATADIDKFLKTGKKALEEAIKMAKVGNRVGHISRTIQSTVQSEGYSVVRSLVGHGVGRSLHEEPEIPGFLNEKINDTPLLREGMTLAIEVIYNFGKSDVIIKEGDGWTIKTKDGSISGLFERTVAIRKEGSLVLTK